MAIPGMDKDVKMALEKGSRGIENIMGSQSRVGKRLSTGVLKNLQLIQGQATALHYLFF